MTACAEHSARLSPHTHTHMQVRIEDERLAKIAEEAAKLAAEKKALQHDELAELAHEVRKLGREGREGARAVRSSTASRHSPGCAL